MDRLSSPEDEIALWVPAAATSLAPIQSQRSSHDPPSAPCASQGETLSKIDTEEVSHLHSVASPFTSVCADSSGRAFVVDPRATSSNSTTARSVTSVSSSRGSTPIAAAAGAGNPPSTGQGNVSLQKDNSLLTSSRISEDDDDGCHLRRPRWFLSQPSPHLLALLQTEAARYFPTRAGNGSASGRNSETAGSPYSTSVAESLQAAEGTPAAGEGGEEGGGAPSSQKAALRRLLVHAQQAMRQGAAYPFIFEESKRVKSCRCCGQQQAAAGPRWAAGVWEHAQHRKKVQHQHQQSEHLPARQQQQWQPEEEEEEQKQGEGGQLKQQENGLFPVLAATSETAAEGSASAAREAAAECAGATVSRRDAAAAGAAAVERRRHYAVTSPGRRQLKTKKKSRTGGGDNGVEGDHGELLEDVPDGDSAAAAALQWSSVATDLEGYHTRNGRRLLFDGGDYSPDYEGEEEEEVEEDEDDEDEGTGKNSREASAGTARIPRDSCFQGQEGEPQGAGRSHARLKRYLQQQSRKPGGVRGRQQEGREGQWRNMQTLLREQVRGGDALLGVHTRSPEEEEEREEDARDQQPCGACGTAVAAAEAQQGRKEREGPGVRTLPEETLHRQPHGVHTPQSNGRGGQGQRRGGHSPQQRAERRPAAEDGGEQSSRGGEADGDGDVNHFSKSSNDVAVEDHDNRTQRASVSAAAAASPAMSGSHAKYAPAGSRGNDLLSPGDSEEHQKHQRQQQQQKKQKQHQQEHQQQEQQRQEAIFYDLYPFEAPVEGEGGSVDGGAQPDNLPALLPAASTPGLPGVGDNSLSLAELAQPLPPALPPEDHDSWALLLHAAGETAAVAAAVGRERRRAWAGDSGEGDAEQLCDAGGGPQEDGEEKQKPQHWQDRTEKREEAEENEKEGKEEAGELAAGIGEVVCMPKKPQEQGIPQRQQQRLGGRRETAEQQRWKEGEKISEEEGSGGGRQTIERGGSTLREEIPHSVVLSYMQMQHQQRSEAATAAAREGCHAGSRVQQRRHLYRHGGSAAAREERGSGATAAAALTEARDKGKGGGGWIWGFGKEEKPGREQKEAVEASSNASQSLSERIRGGRLEGDQQEERGGGAAARAGGEKKPLLWAVLAGLWPGLPLPAAAARREGRLKLGRSSTCRRHSVAAQPSAADREATAARAKDVALQLLQPSEEPLSPLSRSSSLFLGKPETSITSTAAAVDELQSHSQHNFRFVRRSSSPCVDSPQTASDTTASSPDLRSREVGDITTDSHVYPDHTSSHSAAALSSSPAASTAAAAPAAAEVSAGAAAAPRTAITAAAAAAAGDDSSRRRGTRSNRGGGRSSYISPSASSSCVVSQTAVATAATPPSTTSSFSKKIVADGTFFLSAAQSVCGVSAAVAAATDHRAAEAVRGGVMLQAHKVENSPFFITSGAGALSVEDLTSASTSAAHASEEPQEASVAGGATAAAAAESVASSTGAVGPGVLGEASAAAPAAGQKKTSPASSKSADAKPATNANSSGSGMVESSSSNSCSSVGNRRGGGGGIGGSSSSRKTGNAGSSTVCGSCGSTSCRSSAEEESWSTVRRVPFERRNYLLIKKLNFILRHGAPLFHLPMREDGYVRVRQLLELDCMRGVTWEEIYLVVASNFKRRYELCYDINEPERAEDFGEENESDRHLESPSRPSAVAGETAATDEAPAAAAFSVAAALPWNGEASPQQQQQQRRLSDRWLLRATQGHTIRHVCSELLLQRVRTAAALPTCVHGTYLANWMSIRLHGLHRMHRNHIHFAVGLPSECGVLSGMRRNSEVAIYIDVETAMGDGVSFYRSKNNVVLTEGHNGKLSTKYFKKAVHLKWNVTLFENGQDFTPLYYHRVPPELQQQQRQRTQEAAAEEVVTAAAAGLRCSAGQGAGGLPPARSCTTSASHSSNSSRNHSRSKNRSRSSSSGNSSGSRSRRRSSEANHEPLEQHGHRRGDCSPAAAAGEAAAQTPRLSQHGAQE